MKKIIVTIALMMSLLAANAQQDTTSGYEGMTKELTRERMITPYGLEITYDKTVHIIFPSSVRYIDLGSPNIVAGKADGTDNVIRVKAAIKDFSPQSNMSVITEDGSFYSFNVKYADNPKILNVEMVDLIHSEDDVMRPDEDTEVQLEELDGESPALVHLIMKTIYDNDKFLIKYIGCSRFNIDFILKGIYAYNGLLYFHTQIDNLSNMAFDVDFITFKIVDKNVAKRTAIQETIIEPLRDYNFISQVNGNSTERTVFALKRFTIPDDKQLVIELFEKNGGRHQSFAIENEAITGAKTINKLKVK